MSALAWMKTEGAFGMGKKEIHVVQLHSSTPIRWVSLKKLRAWADRCFGLSE